MSARFVGFASTGVTGSLAVSALSTLTLVGAGRLLLCGRFDASCVHPTTKSPQAARNTGPGKGLILMLIGRFYQHAVSVRACFASRYLTNVHRNTGRSGQEGARTI